jgi:pimeloyl-ACP methyl ester carboxylesterase
LKLPNEAGNCEVRAVIINLVDRCGAGILLVIFSLATIRADSRNQSFDDFVAPLPLPAGHTLVIGIVGGWERWDNPRRCTRRTAVEIKRLRLPGVHVETVENHKLELAEQLVERAFPTNRSSARVILFGQSLGGRGVLLLARSLEKMGIRVRLAVVVDGFGRDSWVVPANVSEAANFYQSDLLWLRTAEQIRAADPARTKVLGNWKFSYSGREKEFDLSDYTPLQRTFMGSHLCMEFDRAVWNRVVEMISGSARARD